MEAKDPDVVGLCDVVRVPRRADRLREACMAELVMNFIITSLFACKNVCVKNGGCSWWFSHPYCGVASL